MNLDKHYLETLQELQEALGLHFNNINLLLEAMSHSSYLNENPTVTLQSNERLEFLGDAIIGFVVTERLFREFPLFNEGEMTQLRSRIVSQEGLSILAQQINLGKYLLLSRGEDLTGGRDRDSNLARSFEAFIGALYMDQGLTAVKDFLYGRITTQGILELMTSENFDFKSKLQEHTQAKYKLMPEYETVKEQGPAHERQFAVEVKIGSEVIGKGQGKSKKKAEQEAARYALQNLLHNM